MLKSLIKKICQKFFKKHKQNIRNINCCFKCGRQLGFSYDYEKQTACEYCMTDYQVLCQHGRLNTLNDFEALKIIRGRLNESEVAE